MTNNEFAAWLRAQMARAGVSQADVARGVDINASSLSMYLTTKQRPSVETCQRLAAFFKVPLEEVLIAAGRMTAMDQELEPEAMPDWMRDALEPLTPYQRDVVKRMVEEVSRGFQRGNEG